MRSSSPRSAFQMWSCEAILPEKTRKYVSRPDERVGGGLEDARQERPVGSLLDVDLLARASIALTGCSSSGDGQVAVRSRRGRPRCRYRALAAVTRTGARIEVAHAAMKAGLQLGVADLLALEVLGQHIVVRLGRRLEQLVAPASDLVGQVGRNLRLGPLATSPRRRPCGGPGRRSPASCRPCRWPAGAARSCCRTAARSFVERGGRIRVLTLAAGDHEESPRCPWARPGDTARSMPASTPPEEASIVSSARVGRFEALDHLAGEVGVAGRVDQRDLVTVVVDVATPSESDCLRFCSSGSKSRLAVPSSTLPRRVTAPVAKSRCSARVVLPESE